MIKRRVIIPLSALVSTAVLFSSLNGCSMESKSSKKETPSVTISVLNYKRETGGILSDAASDYERSHPGVRIDVETIQGDDKYEDELIPRLASEPPTIFCIDSPSYLDEYQNFLCDLSDQPWVSHAIPGTLDRISRDGKVYGLPMDLEANGVVINKKIFQAAGIDTSTMKTYEGYKHACEVLKQKIDAGELKKAYPNLNSATEFPGNHFWIYGNIMADQMLSVDFEDAMDAYASKTIPLTANKAYKEFLDFEVAYSKYASKPSDILNVTYTQSLKSNFMNQSVASIVGGSWVIPAIQTNKPALIDDLEILPIPAPGFTDGQLSVGVPSYWAVNSKAPESHINAAKDFLNWLYQDKTGLESFVKKASFIPAFDNCGDVIPKDNVSKNVYDSFVDGNYISSDTRYGAPDAWTTKSFAKYVQCYLKNEMTWDETVEKSRSDWEKFASKKKVPLT